MTNTRRANFKGSLTEESEEGTRIGQQRRTSIHQWMTQMPINQVKLAEGTAIVKHG
jgi:predicted XRE-type DNA-binding protein